MKYKPKKEVQVKSNFESKHKSMKDFYKMEILFIDRDGIMFDSEGNKKVLKGIPINNKVSR